MKTKNVKVRTQDLKAGVTVYVSHPVYGIMKHTITSCPYMEKGIGLFVKCKTHFDDWICESDSFSLRDAGVIGGNSYNGRRTFFKLKHAEAWANKWKRDKVFIAQHARHERSNEESQEMDQGYYDDFYDYL